MQPEDTQNFASLKGRPAPWNDSPDQGKSRGVARLDGRNRHGPGAMRQVHMKVVGENARGFVPSDNLR